MELKIPNIQNLGGFHDIFLEGFLPGVVFQLTFSSSQFFSPPKLWVATSSPLWILGGTVNDETIYIYM